MRNRLFLLVPAVILAAGLALVGCGQGGGGAGKSGGDTIKIGLAGCQTGSDGEIGMAMLNGSQVAIDEWNAKGGVLGKKIEVVSLDDEGQNSKAITVAQSLVDSGVVAVIGHFNSGCTIPASQHYNDAKIIEISPGSTNPRYTDQGFPYAFRICGRDDQQAEAIVAFLRDQLKVDKIAVLNDKTTYGKGLATYVTDDFKAKGGTVVIEEDIDKKDLDFRPSIAKVQGSGAQAVVWGGMYAGGGPLCLQMRQAGLNIPFISDDGCQDQKFVDTVGANAKDVYIFFGRDYTGQPVAQDFIKKFNDTYHRNIGSYSVYGYNAAEVLLESIAKAGTTDSDKVAAVMKGQPFDTIQGKVEFDSKGDLKVADYVVWVVKDGKLQESKPTP